MIQIKATITFDTKANHPDTDGKVVRGLTYTDTYTFNSDYAPGYDSIQEFVEHDLALVAGGGYDTDTITNVRYKVETL